MNADVLIIGAGLSGLSCAATLESYGISSLLLEAADSIGGRVHTDYENGFLLDRGFQVFSTAYPEARGMLDYSALKLRHFAPAAVIRFQGKWHRIQDPFRHPFSALPTFCSPIGTFSDKLRIAKLRHRALSGTIPEIFSRPETPTFQYLQNLGFSLSMIDRFLRPFLGGIFLDPELQTSSRMTEFIFRMFATGRAALPSEGMGAIPRQISRHIPEKNIRTGARVIALSKTTVTLESGEALSASAIIVATEGPVANRLLPTVVSPGYRSVACLYFSAPDPPFTGPYLLLNGEGVGPINNLCVLSQVAPSYSETSRQLLSVSVLNPIDLSEDSLQVQVRRQLRDWFGASVNDWRHIRTVNIDAAQPRQSVPFPTPYTFRSHIKDGIFVCGDFCATGTIDGAIFSGRRAAEEVRAWLNR